MRYWPSGQGVIKWAVRRVIVTPCPEASNLLADLEHSPRNISPPPTSLLTDHRLKLTRFLAPHSWNSQTHTNTPCPSTPEPQISLCFALRLTVSKISANLTSVSPLTIMLNFKVLLHTFKFWKKSQHTAVGTIGNNIQEKSESSHLKYVVGVAFWNFSIGSHIKWGKQKHKKKNRIKLKKNYQTKKKWYLHSPPQYPQTKFQTIPCKHRPVERATKKEMPLDSIL